MTFSPCSIMLDIFNTKEFIIFTTRDYAGVANVSLPAASKRLARLQQDKLITRVTKGVWANTGHPWFHPLACVPYLLNNEQGYVSFLTALHYHGVLSQIPATIQVATTGHSRMLDSNVGRFEFIRLKPELMQQGLQWSGTHLPYLQASAEKALIDILYISTRKNRRFARLPELALASDSFDKVEFEKLFRQLKLPTRITNAMRLRAEKLGVIKQ